MRVSLGAAARPITARAAMKLPYDLAQACQIEVTKNKTPKTKAAALRPKIFENGITMKLAKPSTMIGTPVIQGTSVTDRLNDFAKRGNMGAMDSAVVVCDKVYMEIAATTRA